MIQEKIQSITIENIKGIKNQTFNLDIISNKPSVLVAPNGFGKSSLAIAFNSLNNNRINLDKDYYHEDNSSFTPKISLSFVKNRNLTTLEADNSKNDIFKEFSCFVINSQLYARGIGSRFGTATATMNIEDIVLVDKIPEKAFLNYTYNTFKNLFGDISKILPNINYLLSNKKLIISLFEKKDFFDKAISKRTQNAINIFINKINTLPTNKTKDEILTHTENNLSELRNITCLKCIADIIKNYGTNEVSCYLSAIQFIWLYNNNKNSFKKVYEYYCYQVKKEKIEGILSTFNSTWKNIKAKEERNQLVVKFPPAKDISNGQRDVLSFISMLFKAREKLTKSSNILIIDEVFDYLDDANLVAVQYYITKFIDEMKKEGKNIYPLILTHLDPSNFEIFAFKGLKIYYLNKQQAQKSIHFEKLLRARKEDSIEEEVSKYLLHYHTEKINKRDDFRSLGLKETWGEGNNFKNYINEEVEKYLKDEDYDPFAVCCAVRVKIEENVYNRLNKEEDKVLFLGTHETRKKLNFAESKGVPSPEIYYLLGIIYNKGMHWEEDKDNVTPIVNALTNLAIKQMIKEVFK
ncbi:hypothetical protein CGC53_06775 [Capnocytophaga leadbetteri]|uniref:AAA domain-containing protein n=1 Tax=Capnocytophaga leadbetteri TaxID=327575 RepID=A0A250FDG4_9FLAO|nr:hypothetical protein [Capnocytophaga leadbetteri]ATA82067.1 hypothetical protein CGC53_06775 [Capnocytophaga leadbetteri]